MTKPLEVSIDVDSHELAVERIMQFSALLMEQHIAIRDRLTRSFSLINTLTLGNHSFQFNFDYRDGKLHLCLRGDIIGSLGRIRVMAARKYLQKVLHWIVSGSY